MATIDVAARVQGPTLEEDRCSTNLFCDIMKSMRSTIQARLDERSQKALAKLVNRLGWSPSRVVREGLRLLAVCNVGKGRHEIIGLGGFASGLRDLGSNKKHLRGFGR